MNRRFEPRTVQEARLLAGISVPAGAHLSGVSESALYAAVQRGEVESVRLCGRILIKSAPFLALFGLEVDDETMEASSASVDSEGAHECKSCGWRSK